MSYPTAGDHRARQQEGINNFLDGVAEQKRIKDKMVAEDLVATAAVMVATYAYESTRLGWWRTTASFGVAAPPSSASS